MSTEAELIKACRDNDQGAWDTLIDRYSRLVYTTARSWGLNESDTDDVFQSVFMILLRRLDTIRDAERLGSWLITTTRRECWRLSRNRPVTSDVQEQELATTSATYADAGQLEQQYLVWLALEELGGPCEELLRALFARGKSEAYTLIAQRLGIEVGSIGPTRARCFQKLEPILARMGVEPGSRKSDSDPEK